MGNCRWNFLIQLVRLKRKMDNHFGGVIWTNHALDRLRQRGIKQGDAWATFNRPEQSKKGASGNWVYYRNWGGEQIEVVAKQDEKRKWVVLSVWSRRVAQNQSQYAHKELSHQKPSFWRSLYNFIFKT